MIRKYRDLFIGTSMCVASTIGYAAYCSGSIGSALSFLSGQRIFVDPKIDLGKVRCGENVNAKIEVNNSSGKSVSVVGARKSCGCIGLEAFPVEVKAGSTYPLGLVIQIPEKSTKFAQFIELYIAEEGQSFVPFSVSLSGIATE